MMTRDKDVVLHIRDLSEGWGEDHVAYFGSFDGDPTVALFVAGSLDPIFLTQEVLKVLTEQLHATLLEPEKNFNVEMNYD